jgi:hypothetical protein
LRVLRPTIDGAMLLHATVSSSDDCPGALAGLNSFELGDTSPSPVSASSAARCDALLLND